MHQTHEIARLILLNGAPGVGKSSLARRYLDDHALTLLVDLDGLRASLGQWPRSEESAQLARDLGLAMAETHLRAGHDVIVPQYLGRMSFILALESLAATLDASFIELVLVCDHAIAVERFATRRRTLPDGASHPEGEICDDGIDVAIAEAARRLDRIRAERPNTEVVDASGTLDGVYPAMLGAIGAATS